ncbi:MAG: hypothetical protein QOE01_3416, partial [Actinomycetota bacterium]|nr:hypothetical protein [Actinomycetota bacterium]
TTTTAAPPVTTVAEPSPTAEEPASGTPVEGSDTTAMPPQQTGGVAAPAEPVTVPQTAATTPVTPPATAALTAPEPPTAPAERDATKPVAGTGGAPAVDRRRSARARRERAKGARRDEILKQRVLSASSSAP